PVGDSLITVLESQTFGFPVYTIARTTDLIHWQTLAETNRPLIALTYWPDKHLLLAAERGQLAQIWQLNLAEIRTPPVLHNKSSR
ncbi:MAG: hypothetical protein GY796_20940, partial [Chloroflexi bacterium]|nr:hypothetical protein [Chloroflexota bacterium]